MSEPLVTYEFDAECSAVKIGMNRPESRNALSIELVEALLDAVHRAASEQAARSVILTGTDSVFAAGADINELAERDHVSETSARSAQRRQLAQTLETMDKPTIAAINGHAVGGGLELALACTFRVAADDAKIGLPEVGIGILPGNGGTQRLTRLIGVGPAMELILLGELVDAPKASALGIVHRTVPRKDIGDAADDIARRIAAKPRRSIAAAKELVLSAWDIPVDTGIAYENKWFAILCGSPDKQEGVAAFQAKRTPQFD